MTVGRRSFLRSLGVMVGSVLVCPASALAQVHRTVPLERDFVPCAFARFRAISEIQGEQLLTVIGDDPVTGSRTLAALTEIAERLGCRPSVRHNVVGYSVDLEPLSLTEPT